MTADEPTPARSDRRGPIAAVVAGLSIVVLYLWDDAIFAGPIVVGARVFGAFPAFIFFVLVYGGLNLVVALLVVRAYDRRSGDKPSRLERWTVRQADSRRSTWAKRMIASGRILGFVVASFLLGGIVTTWLVRYSGQRERIGLVALASSAIFAVTFVGFYSGITKVLVNR